MSWNIIKTERLVLRSLEMADAADITRLIGDWEVMRWLTSPPWPYALADAEWFLNGDASIGSWAITVDGRYVGAVGVSDQLGYWLGQEYWGRGIMTEAARAVVGECFSRSSAALGSGYLLGNTASSRILNGLGFRDTVVKTEFSNPLGTDVQVQKMQLSLKDWQASNV